MRFDIFSRSARLAITSGFLATVGAIAPVLLLSASALTEEAQSPSILDVPTTKILAIGSFTAKGTPEHWKPLVLAEVRDTVRLYLTGKLEQWYIKQDHSGVVFLMNVTDPNAARALLERFPFGQAGLMEFEYIPLGPIAPLRVLLADPSK